MPILTVKYAHGLRGVLDSITHLRGWLDTCEMEIRDTLASLAAGADVTDARRLHPQMTAVRGDVTVAVEHLRERLSVARRTYEATEDAACYGQGRDRYDAALRVVRDDFASLDVQVRAGTDRIGLILQDLEAGATILEIVAWHPGQAEARAAVQEAIDRLESSVRTARVAWAAAMADAGMNQKAIARVMGVSRQMVAKLQGGRLIQRGAPGSTSRTVNPLDRTC